MCGLFSVYIQDAACKVQSVLSVSVGMSGEVSIHGCVHLSKCVESNVCSRCSCNLV